VTASPSRRAARRRGQWGEILAAWWLRLKGYRVLARSYAIGRGRGAGEIDLIVRRGGVIAFVEIKARASLAEAAHAISAAQLQRIIRGAQAFVSGHPELAACVLRFDAVLVAPGCFPRHISDAWRMDT
jgi:putative endonuclease